jgi:hypothetical protein
LEALELESKEDKGKNKRMDRIRHYRKVIDLYRSDENEKENTKNNHPGEVDMLITIDGQNEMLQEIKQHGEEAVQAAITLRDLSGATSSE